MKTPEIKLDNETIICALLGEMIRKVRETKSIETVLEYAARINKMYTEDEWVSVETRNPDKVGLYEVFCNDGLHLMANVNTVGWWTIPFGEFSGDMGPKFVRDSKEVDRQVTHWKLRSPLPQPPSQTNKPE